MSEIKMYGRLGLYGAEHFKCNCMMTLGFKAIKGLKSDVAGMNTNNWRV